MMAGQDIIDCHEHLVPEKERTDNPQDVFTLFSTYTMCDLASAGMDVESWTNEKSLQRRWEKFKPYFAAIRHGSYARAALLTAKMVYGFDDINDDNYQALSEAIAAENTPGIYKRMLCDRCRIRASLTQCSAVNIARPLVPVMLIEVLTQIRRLCQLESLAGELGKDTPKTLDDYLALAEDFLHKWIAEGAVGIKMFSRPYINADRKAAEGAFAKLLNGEELEQPSGFCVEVLENYLTHKLVDMAAELDLVVAVHAGVWADFRYNDSKNMLSFIPEHPRAKFDLFHLGMPSVRDTIMIGKDFPNVFLNLCWTHIVSQVQACSGIDELIDQVPTSKVFAFGGDYAVSVEKVVGHLHMAKENFAQVFGRRIDRGLMSFDEAAEIIKLWFWDNPLRVYSRLKV